MASAVIMDNMEKQWKQWEEKILQAEEMNDYELANDLKSILNKDKELVASYFEEINLIEQKIITLETELKKVNKDRENKLFQLFHHKIVFN
ncbi:seryl-tRNA synthetase [Lachnospiraceae bacterium PF1-22]